VEPRTLLREDEVALPCSWITAPDYCNKSDELRAEEESFCVSKSVRPGAISLPLDLARERSKTESGGRRGGGGRGSDDWSLGCRFGNPKWHTGCLGEKRNGPTAHRSKEIVPGAVRATPADRVNFISYTKLLGWSKNIFIPKTQLAPAVSLFSFPTRGSHNYTSSSPPLPQVKAGGGIEWVPLIGGGGEVPFIKGMEGSFSPWRKRGKGVGKLL
jgi:hypothetical protein